MPTFEDRVRELLTLAKCTQEDAATLAGVRVRTVTAWANGARVPGKLDAVYRLCDKLGFSGYKTLLHASWASHHAPAPSTPTEAGGAAVGGEG